MREIQMAKVKKGPVGRRGFLKGAAASAAAIVSEPHVAHTHAHQDHDHDHQAVPADLTLRVKALESLLVEKGLVDRAALDAIVDTYEHKVGPHIGARIVARAWVDAEYKRRLLTDADAAITELGMGGQEGQSMRVIENTPKMHNVVVCTLCSCYPWSVLGLPPVWYKSTAYRARAVIDPRAVLREFGLEVTDDVDRKSTRLNSSHDQISYAVFCLKKKIAYSTVSSFGTLPASSIAVN